MEQATTASFGLDTVNVNVSSIVTSRGHDHKNGSPPRRKTARDSCGLPLIITPRWDNSLEFLVQWCKSNQEWLDQKLVQYGAILVRGFEIETASHLERAIRACHADLNNVRDAL